MFFSFCFVKLSYFEVGENSWIAKKIYQNWKLPKGIHMNVHIQGKQNILQIHLVWYSTSAYYSLFAKICITWGPGVQKSSISIQEIISRLLWIHSFDWLIHEYMYSWVKNFLPFSFVIQAISRTIRNFSQKKSEKR